MRKVLFVSLHPLHQLGGGERFTLEAYRSVQCSGDLCVGYALDHGFPGDASLAQRLGKQFHRFEGGGLVNEPQMSLRQLLVLAADFDVLWVHQYLSNVMVFDILGNAACSQTVILTGEGHEPEFDQFGACFQPCPGVSIVEISDYASVRSRRFGKRVWSVSAGVWNRDIIIPDTSPRIPGQICSTGRILPHKGIEITLAGAPEGSTLKVIGSTSLDSNYTRYLATVPVLANVEFLGEVDDLVKQNLMRNSEVFVASSTEMLFDGRIIPQAELLGLVIMEALAAGALPVTSDVPSFVEVMRNLGLSQFVYPQRAEFELREILTETLGMSLTMRKSVIVAAQRELQRHYLWDDYWTRVKRVIGLESRGLAAGA